MRLLFFSSVFPRPRQPTRGIYCLRLCEALAEAGHDVRVVSPASWLERLRGGPGGPTRQARVEGLIVDYPTFYYPPGVLRNTHAGFMWASVRRRLRSVIRAFDPHCVISYWAHPDGAVAVRAAREHGVPAVTMVGGSDALVLAREPTRRPAILRVLREADAVAVVGRDLQNVLVGFGVPARRVHVVYRGVDGSRFCPGSKADARQRLRLEPGVNVLLFVGSLLPVKGLDLLLDACRRLLDRGVGYRLYLVGGGAMRKSLEAQSKSLGLCGAVTFVGPVGQDDLPDWYRAADLTVLPSRSEGIPNVLRESIACGTPFVASRVGGIPEITDEQTCRLVPPGNAEALAAAVEEMMSRAATDGAGHQIAAIQGTWADSAEALLGVIRPLAQPAAERRQEVGVGSA